jgi:hypothetical protein
MLLNVYRIGKEERIDTAEGLADTTEGVKQWMMMLVCRT